MKTKIGNFFGFDWSPKGQGVQAAGDTVVKGGGKPLSGIGDVVKFGSGASGNYTTLPASKGAGWGNNKDLILAAAGMAGVDGKGLASLIAMESGFDPNAAPKNPNLPSSAKGFGQHLDGTWQEDLQRDGARFGIPEEAESPSYAGRHLSWSPHGSFGRCEVPDVSSRCYRCRSSR
jgi:hypothetical protein